MTSNDGTRRAWVAEALRRIEADARRSADTHLIPLELPEAPGITLYLKDESTHPSGSLKHRLARSLFLYGLCNGLIGPGTTIVEASSGSTAISEAHFARLLGLPFVAVVPWLLMVGGALLVARSALAYRINFERGWGELVGGVVLLLVAALLWAVLTAWSSSGTTVSPQNCMPA